MAAFCKSPVIAVDTESNVVPNTEDKVEIVEEDFTEDNPTLSANENASRSSADCKEFSTGLVLAKVLKI